MEPGRPAPMLSGQELAVDKVLAVFGRAEARDFVDPMAVERRYGLNRLGQLAVEKDRGFTPKLFAEMLGQFGRLRQEEFGIGTPKAASHPTSHKQQHDTRLATTPDRPAHRAAQAPPADPTAKPRSGCNYN